jgi:hypothetical protein
MVPKYSVSTDPARGLLRLTLAGFFDLSTVALFAAERDAAVLSLRRLHDQHVTLCDIRHQMISSSDVTAAFRTMIADPRYTSRKLAFVISGALERMQTRRTATDRDNVGYFTDVASAEVWLMAGDESVAV